MRGIRGSRLNAYHRGSPGISRDFQLKRESRDASKLRMALYGLCLCPWGDFKRWDDGKKLTRDKLMRLVCFERKGNTFAKESTRYVSSPCQGIVPSLSPEISSGVSSGLDAKGEIPSSGDTMAATGTRRMDEKDMKTDLTPFVNNLVKR
eukprot:1364338-Amorphochlora_amoeboformis.AAC.2